MSFQRRANRSILLGAVVFPALVVLLAVIPGMAPWVDAAVPALVLVILIGGAAGLVLPVVSMSLDRLGHAHEGPLVRRVGLAMALLLLVGGAVALMTADGFLRLAGATLAAGALAALVAGWRHRPAPAAGKAPPFGSTVAGFLFVLASFMVVPYFGQTRDRAYTRTMMSDLRNFASHQETHFDSAGAYSEEHGELSRGVTLRIDAGSDGWSAIATHAFIDGTCAIYEGRPPVPPATEPLVVACNTEPMTPLGQILGWMSTFVLAAGALLFAVGYGASRRSRRRENASRPSAQDVAGG